MPEPNFEMHPLVGNATSAAVPSPEVTSAVSRAASRMLNVLEPRFVAERIPSGGGCEEAGARITTSVPYDLFLRREQARAAVLDAIPSLDDDEVAHKLHEAADAYGTGALEQVRRIADALAKHEHGSHVHSGYRWWLRARIQEFAIIEYALAVLREPPATEQMPRPRKRTPPPQEKALAGVGPSSAHTLKDNQDV